MNNKYLEKIASNRYVKEILLRSKNWKTPVKTKGDAKYLSIHSISPTTGVGPANGFVDTGLHRTAVKDILERKYPIGHTGKTIDLDHEDIMDHLRKKIKLP